MKIKEILELTIVELEKMMSSEEYDRMQDLHLETCQLLDALKDSARLSGQEDDEEHTTISAYLNYLEEMKQ
ncbi:MAG: hypothetical protein J6A89_04215 [Clostridia bacterium]|nr:hypothetical protein [Clostridia bacterium]